MERFPRRVAEIRDFMGELGRGEICRHSSITLILCLSLCIRPALIGRVSCQALRIWSERVNENSDIDAAAIRVEHFTRLDAVWRRREFHNKLQ